MQHIPNDISYYAKREQQCRALADRALDPNIKELHLQFAENYADTLRSVAADGADRGRVFAAG